MGSSDSFVKFDKVDKSYDGKVLVVKDLNLDINEGEFITMLMRERRLLGVMGFQSSSSIN